MEPPMVGNWIVEVNAVRTFTIHGDLYYELNVLRTDSPNEGAFILRVPQHAVQTQPAPGSRMTISFLMGQVTSARGID